MLISYSQDFIMKVVLLVQKKPIVERATKVTYFMVTSSMSKNIANNDRSEVILQTCNINAEYSIIQYAI